MSPAIEVIYALHLKPGDWYAGIVDKDAPTTPVQPFARAQRVGAIESSKDDDGRKWMDITAAAGFALTPVLAASQVLVIREGTS